MYLTDGANPLPRLSNGFVARLVRGGKLFIKPILPKPDELYTFWREAEAAGFKDGPMGNWSGHKAPKYWVRVNGE